MSIARKRHVRFSKSRRGKLRRVERRFRTSHKLSNLEG